MFSRNHRSHPTSSSASTDAQSPQSRDVFQDLFGNAAMIEKMKASSIQQVQNGAPSGQAATKASQGKSVRKRGDGFSYEIRGRGPLMDLVVIHGVNNFGGQWCDNSDRMGAARAQEIKIQRDYNKNHRAANEMQSKYDQAEQTPKDFYLVFSGDLQTCRVDIYQGQGRPVTLTYTFQEVAAEYELNKAGPILREIEAHLLAMQPRKPVAGGRCSVRGY